jgi:hypothetical protein
VVDRKRYGRWPVRVAGLVNWWGIRVKFREGFQVGKCVYLFRICKRKHIFMKINMTGDINTLRC